MRPWIVLLFVILFRIPSAAHADGLFVEAGWGFNYTRSETVFLRYYKDTSPVFGLNSFYDFSLASWNGPSNNHAVTIGRGVLWGWTEEFYSSFEAGGAYLWKTTENLGTRLQLAFRFAFGLKAGKFDISAGYNHFSNGKEIYSWSNGTNRGENFVTLQIGRMF